jgi:flagellar protein FlaG
MGEVTLSTVRPVQAAIDSGAHSAEASKTASSQSAPQARPAKVDVQTAIQQLEAAATNYNVNLNFSVDKDTGRTVIRVIDASTNEVLRQLPPEEILDLAASMEAIAGRLLSVKA